MPSARQTLLGPDTEVAALLHKAGRLGTQHHGGSAAQLGFPNRTYATLEIAWAMGVGAAAWVRVGHLAVFGRGGALAFLLSVIRQTLVLGDSVQGLMVV